jgi:glycosyltransferase involved in cell wall biosynthesis
MRILYFYQYFTTPKGSWSTRVYEFSRRWVKAGHSVTVVTSVYDKSDLRPQGVISKFDIDGIDVRVINIRLSNKHGVAFRLFTFLAYALFASWYALVLPADVVVSSSGPITVGIPGLVARYVRRRPLIFEVRDLWPDGAIQLGIIRHPLIIRLAKLFERSCYRAAFTTVAVSEGMAEWMRTSYGLRHVAVIPNPSDSELFRANKSNGRISGALRNKKLVLYAGTLGVVNDCWQIIRMAEYLQLRNENQIQVLLIGDGKERSELQKYVRQNSVTNISFLGTLPKDQVASWLTHSCCALLALRPLPLVDTGSPNKLCDAFAAGVPVVQTTTGWMKDFLERERCGLSVPPNDPAAMAEAVLQMTRDEGYREELAKNARRVAHEFFDQDALAAKMENVLRMAAVGAIRE